MIKTIEDMKMSYVPRHDKEVFELFMDKCEEFGFSWGAYSSGEPRDIKSGEVVVFIGSANKLLTHTSEAYAAAKDYKRLTLSDLKPRTRTEYEKFTGSIFDLRDEFERGELYTKGRGAGGDFFKKITTEYELITFASCGLYRKVEKEIDWQDEVKKLDNSAIFHDDGDLFLIIDSSSGDFISMCHEVASLTEKPTN